MWIRLFYALLYDLMIMMAFDGFMCTCVLCLFLFLCCNFRLEMSIHIDFTRLFNNEIRMIMFVNVFVCTCGSIGETWEYVERCFFHIRTFTSHQYCCILALLVWMNVNVSLCVCLKMIWWTGNSVCLVPFHEILNIVLGAFKHIVNYWYEFLWYELA